LTQSSCDITATAHIKTTVTSKSEVRVVPVLN
jgi:hypothetical protein